MCVLDLSFYMVIFKVLYIILESLFVLFIDKMLIIYVMVFVGGFRLKLLLVNFGLFVFCGEKVGLVVCW